MKAKKQSQNLTEIATGTGTHSIGIDLGDRFSQFCILDADGEVIEEGLYVAKTPFASLKQPLPRNNDGGDLPNEDAMRVAHRDS
jgi:hypothetical protein